MMKRAFEEPEVLIVSLEISDVITSSGDDNTGSFDGEWVPIT